MVQVVWLVLVCCPPPGGAPAGGPDELRVTVVTVLATTRNHHIDPKLKDFAAEIRKKHPALTGFRLERVTTKPVELRQPEDFELLEGATLEVTVQSREEKTGRFRLTVKPPDRGDICYSCCCGKFFPLFADVAMKDKSRVIYAIMIRPCPGK
jgi:hypothetical protein